MVYLVYTFNKFCVFGLSSLILDIDGLAYSQHMMPYQCFIILLMMPYSINEFSIIFNVYNFLLFWHVVLTTAWVGSL